MLAVVLILVILLIPITPLAVRPVVAQMIGLSALLNPEGSRLFPQSIIVPRHPGKPDLRWKSFDWQFMDLHSGPTPYRLYFYKEEEWPARFAIPRINQQIESLRKDFNFSPSEKFSYLLFTSQREFQQANIFFISEGVQGITSTTEATMAIPYWGDAHAFDHISKHEMVHQFQVQKMNARQDFRSPEQMGLVPLWFIEGMAEYYSLNGVDPESRAFIRDILLHPDPQREYRMPDLFLDGPLDFIRVYKIGQAKIAFFESEFGKGTVQRLLEMSARRMGDKYPTFKDFVAHELNQSAEILENKWKGYLEKNFKAEADRLSQAMDSYEVIAEVGDTLDTYDISPDGRLLVTREVEPLTGITSIQLRDMSDLTHKIEVTHDNQPSVLSLYFLRLPSLTLSNQMIGYIVETTSGPELETRSIRRDEDGELHLGGAHRVKLHQHGLIQASSIVFSPDGQRVAIIGLDRNGWTNIYLVEDLFTETAKLRALTASSYGWQTLSWNAGSAGISGDLIGSSDQTENGKHGLFQVNVQTGALRQLTAPPADQFAVDRAEGRIFFQSWESGSSQIHELVGGVGKGQEIRVTEAKTGLQAPKYRNGRLYAIGFKGGRYRLFRVKSMVSSTVKSFPLPAYRPWKIELANLPEDQVMRYKPFISSGTRVDGLMAYFASGTVGGVSATVSDLMRNYSITGEFSVLGSFKFTNALVFFTSSEGRTKWTAGTYALLQPRLDNIFADDDTSIRTYLHREFGVLGALQYPLGAFSYLDAELRVAGVKRSDFSDGLLAPQWDAVNPGTEFLTSPMLRFGYDRIVYELYSGALKGFGFLVESDTSFFPSRSDSTSERVRFDVAYYLPLTGRMVLALQGLGGVAWGGTFRNPFLVSSDDIMRGYVFQDERLFGNYLVAAKTELRFPIGSLFGFPPLRGLAAYDIGSITRDLSQLGGRIAESATGGISLNIPPLSINFMLSYPIRSAPGPMDRPVSHFTLRYLYL